MKKKIISLLLAVVMIVGMLPLSAIPAFADGGTSETLTLRDILGTVGGTYSYDMSVYYDNIGNVTHHGEFTVGSDVISFENKIFGDDHDGALLAAQKTQFDADGMKCWDVIVDISQTEYGDPFRTDETVTVENILNSEVFFSEEETTLEGTSIVIPAGSYFFEADIGDGEELFVLFYDMQNDKTQKLFFDNMEHTREVEEYTITVKSTEHGTVTVEPSEAAEGDTVTITLTPDEGYALVLNSLNVTYEYITLNVIHPTPGNNGTYTFTMPAYDVTVEAMFNEADMTLADIIGKIGGTYSGTTTNDTEQLTTKYYLSENKIIVEWISLPFAEAELEPSALKTVIDKNGSIQYTTNNFSGNTPQYDGSTGVEFPITIGDYLASGVDLTKDEITVPKNSYYVKCLDAYFYDEVNNKTQKMCALVDAEYVVLDRIGDSPDEPVHEHTFSDEWSNSPTHHWHDAACEHTEFVSGFGAHTFDEGVTEGNKTTYTCTVCGYQKIVYNTAGDNEGEIISGVSYTGISLTLGSDIAINFYMELTDEARQNGTMTFDIGGRIVTGIKVRKNENGYYFSTPLTALEMAETVKATFTYNGIEYVQEYSVQDYIDKIVGNEEKYGTEAAALARKIANYGHYAQIYLESIHTNVHIVDSGDGYDRMDKFANFDIDTQAAIEALANYKVQVTGTSNNLSLYGSTVYFDSATALNYYVTVKNGVKPSATAQNTKTGKSKDVEIKLYKDNIYIVSVKDITATELADDIEVKINNDITLTGSVFAYCNSVIAAHSFDGATAKDIFAVNAMAAFYEYYEAAMEYAESLSTYTVTFDMGDHGEQVSNQKVEKDGKVTKPADPTADGYLFCGWWTDEYCIESEWDFDTDTVNADITIYAKWLKIYDSDLYLNTGDFNDEIFKIEMYVYLSNFEKFVSYDVRYLGNGLYNAGDNLKSYANLFMLEEEAYSIVFNDSGIKAFEKIWHPDDGASMIAITGKTEENTYIFEYNSIQ